jgi:hypothetical protein
MAEPPPPSLLCVYLPPQSGADKLPQGLRCFPGFFRRMRSMPVKANGEHVPHDSFLVHGEEDVLGP